MKLNNIYTAAFLMLLASGCQKETVPSQEFEGIEFKVVTNVVSRAASPFETGKTFILSIDQTNLGQINDIGDYIDKKMSHSTGAWLPEGNTPNPAWEWVDDKPAKVTAFHIPRADYSSNNSTLTQISGSVTDQLNADVLYYNETITSKSSELAINFKHLLCKIEVPVPKDMGENTISSITIKSVKTEYTWTPNTAPTSLSTTDCFQNGIATAGTTGPSDIVFTEDSETNSWYCILPPQNLNGIKLEVTYSNGSQTETFDDAEIESGGKYKINNFTYKPAAGTASAQARSGKAGLTLTKVCD